MKKRNITNASTLFLLTIISLSGASLSGVLSPVLAEPSQPAEKKPPASQKLHRADFRVSGASCVICLRRIGRILRAQKGVITGDVSINRPYWAVVIYDAAETNMDKIQESVVKESAVKEKVKFEEIEDKPISQVPLIVVPNGMSNSLTPGGIAPAAH